MSNLGQGYWKCRPVEGTHTRDKGEKEKFVAPHLLRVSARLLFAESWTKTKDIIKFKCGQSVAWVGYDEIVRPLTCSKFGWSFFGPISHPHFYTRVADQIIKDNKT